MVRTCAWLLLASVVVAGEVSKAEVAAAVEKGAAYLESVCDKNSSASARELIALTLLHAGRRPIDEIVHELLERIRTEEPLATYNTALAAVAFTVADKQAYRGAIARCGQWLVDAQCANGDWTYDGPTMAQALRAPQARRDGDDALRPQRRALSARGDHSNTQFALYGLWAVTKAGFEVPKNCWERAASAWRNSQEGGGWSYFRDGPEYGSMTAGGITSLAICQEALGEKADFEAEVRGGVRWLESNYTVTENPGLAHHAYYYIYSLERACAFTRTQELAEHEWWQEGARVLLSLQREDGSWEEKPTSTCFALLFLTRSTERTIATNAAGEAEDDQRIAGR